MQRQKPTNLALTDALGNEADDAPAGGAVGRDDLGLAIVLSPLLLLELSPDVWRVPNNQRNALHVPQDGTQGAALVLAKVL